MYITSRNEPPAEHVDMIGNAVYTARWQRVGRQSYNGNFFPVMFSDRSVSIKENNFCVPVCVAKALSEIVERESMHELH